MAWLDILTTVPATAARTLYEAATGPSTEAQKAFEDLKAAWSALFAWGFFEKLYTLEKAGRPQWDEWVRYRTAWEGGNPDPTGLSAHVADYHVAEALAREYKGREVPPYPTGPFSPSGTDPLAPDVEAATPALKAAASTDKAAQTATQVSTDFAKDLGTKARALPWWVYGAAAGIGLAYVGGLWAVNRLTSPRSLLRGPHEAPPPGPGPRSRAEGG